MSIKLMAAVFESTKLSPTERLVMLALADHADDAGRCYPSIARICARTGLTERPVQKTIRALQAGGHLTIEDGGGKHRPNVYHVTANPVPQTPFQKPRFANTVSETPNPVPKTPEPSVTIITKEGTHARSKPRRPEVTLPDDWTPSDRNIEDAENRHFSAQEIRHEADQFRNHHISKGSRFRDWDRAWLTWLGNARKFAHRGMAGTSQPGGRGQGGSIASIVARRHLGS